MIGFLKFVFVSAAILACVSSAQIGPPIGAELAVVECKVRYRVPREDIERLKERHLPETRNGKCMLACILKKMNVITKKGDFDLKSVQRWLRNRYKDDTETLKRANTVAETCARSLPTLATNDECDMAVEIMSCVRRQSKLARKKNEQSIDKTAQKLNVSAII
ncbi:PBP/GOBP family [Nesidiocoris tenuis]|uniref:PBP/GOBP family n=1 Tax=Nesidiocoris tenuis TaxID=355587 RepID=A0ABN7B8X4_9HEMI|nr:PBP/GOBP family [Nesidiocoris tenuis]